VDSLRTELNEAFRLLGEGHFERARERFERVLESVSPREVQARTEALRGKAAALRALGQVDAALTCLEQAQWIAPGNPQVLVEIAETVRTVDLDSLRGPQLLASLRTMAELAATLLQRGFADHAQALCDRVIERDPADRQLLARTWATKGLSLRQAGFAQAALEWLDRALAVEPQNRRLAQERAATLAALQRVGRG